MSGKIIQKQNSKEAQQKNTEKKKKPKGTRPKTLPGLPTRQVANVPKIFVTNRS